jgi:hypothetical protein
MSENYDWASKRVYKAVQNLKSAIQRFKNWQENGFTGPHSNYYNSDNNDTAFNIYCLRTKKGNKWYYYNVMNDKDLDKMKLHKAKMALGHHKRISKLDEELDWIESNPEEYKNKKEAIELRNEQKRREIRLYKRLMKIESQIAGIINHKNSGVEEIQERLSSCSTTEEKEIQLKLEEYAAELKEKQIKHNLKEQQKKEKELLDKKPHIDISLNKKIDVFIEDNKTKDFIIFK